MVRLVRLQFNNTKPKVSFTVKSASYQATMRAVSSLQVLTPICLTKTRLASFLGFLTVVKLAITVPGMYAGSDHNVLNWRMDRAYFLNEIGILTLVARKLVPQATAYGTI